MADNEAKRVVIRIDPKTWEQWDDKRHAERLSFQDLGVRLFSRWFAAVPQSESQYPKPVSPTEQVATSTPSGDKLSHVEKDAVKALLNLLRGEDTAIAAAVCGLLKPYRETIDHAGAQETASSGNQRDLPARRRHAS